MTEEYHAEVFTEGQWKSISHFTDTDQIVYNPDPKLTIGEARDRCFDLEAVYPHLSFRVMLDQ